MYRNKTLMLGLRKVREGGREGERVTGLRVALSLSCSVLLGVTAAAARCAVWVRAAVSGRW